MAKYSMIITFEGLFSEKIQEILLWGYKYIILKRFSDRYNEFILKFYKNIKKNIWTDRGGIDFVVDFTGSIFIL